MAGLLVSVRSVEEALAALAGRASVVDIKEPANGPLGRAPFDVWHAIREVVPSEVPLSVALGELAEFNGVGLSVAGIRYRKLGLAGSGEDWRERWKRVRLESGSLLPLLEGGSLLPRDHFDSTGMAPIPLAEQAPRQQSGTKLPHSTRSSRVQSGWIAVAYADWASSGAPDPFAVLEEALGIPDCAGVLVDTFQKGQTSPLRVSTFWRDWVETARDGGLLIALAGEVDVRRMRDLAPLRPDLFAVRGAACEDGDRRGTISADRVAGLVEAAARL